MAESFSSTQLLDPARVLREAQVRQGESIADFGCGAVGHFIFPASREVGPEGHVYAIDIQRSVLSSVESRIRLQNLHNIQPLWGDIERLHGVRLADQLFDVVLLINNLFLAKHREELAEEVRRTLRPDGRLVVVDWTMARSPLGPPAAERVDPRLAEGLFQKHGFVLDHSFRPGPYHWGLVFRRAS